MTGSQLDYLILLAGVPYIGLAGACYMLSRESPARVNWRWISAFGCMLCVHIWMELAELVSGGMRSGVAENLVLLLSYLSLFAFALSQPKIEWRYRVLWYLVPVSIAATIFLPAGSLAETLITVAIGIPSALMTCYALWLWAEGLPAPMCRLGRAFALLFPAIPLVELALGYSFAWEIKAGEHAMPTYIGYIVVGSLLSLLACTLDSHLIKREWNTAAVRSNLFHLILLLGSLVAVFACGWVLTQHLSRLTYNQIRNDAQRRDVVLAERISSMARTCEKVARVLTSSHDITSAVIDRSPETVSEVQENLLRVGQAFEGLLILLMDANGTVIAADKTGEELVGVDARQWACVKQALTGLPGMGTVVGADGARLLAYAQPLAMDGRTAGALAVAAQMQPVEDEFPRDKNIALVSPDGTIWMSSRPEWNFRRMWGSPPANSTDHPSSLSLTARHAPVVTGDEVLCEAQLHLVNTQQSGPLGWSLVSLSSLSEVQRSRGIALLATGAAAVILITLALAIRQRTESLVAADRRSTLEQNMQQMERLISVLSHDLRTPLSASRATVDYLLMEEQLSAESRELLTNVGDQQMRMADMVTRMLDAMRIRSGAMEWSWDNVDVARVLQSAKDTVLALPTRPPNVAIKLHVEEDVGTIRGDAQSVRRLVENLASNAIRHTKEGSVTITAEKVTQDRDHWLRISVEDTGEGMDEQILGLLGRPFVLGGRHKGSGSGLGVGICCGICAAHGGRLEVRSQPGEGSTFIAWLRMDLEAPQRPASEPAVRILS